MTLKKPPKYEPTDIPLPDKLLDEEGKKLQLDQKLIEEAKRLAGSTTKRDLADLRDRIEQNPGFKQLTEEDQDKINQLIVVAERRRFFDRLRDEVAKSGSDFIGSDKNFEQHPTYKKLYAELQKIFDATDKNIPAHYQKEWMDVMLKVVVDRVDSFTNDFFQGRMDETDVDKLLADLKDLKKTGVGSFEQWFSDRHKEAVYKAWKEKKSPARRELAEKKKQLRQSLTKAITALDELGKTTAITTVAADVLRRIEAAKTKDNPELTQIAEQISHLPQVAEQRKQLKANFDEKKAALPQGLEDASGFQNFVSSLERDVNAAFHDHEIQNCRERIDALPAFATSLKETLERAQKLRIDAQVYNDLYPALATEAEGMEQQIKSFSDPQALEQYKPTITTAESKLATLASVRELLGNTEIPAETRKKIQEDLKAGTETPDSALAKLEQTKKTEEDAASQLDSGEEGTLDKLQKFVDGMQDGKWKRVLGALTGLLVGISMRLMKLPWIGDKLRGNKVISNKTLAEKGDEKAALAYRAEKHFVRFGLPRSIIDDLGDAKTKDVIETLKKKPEDINSDEDFKPKLAQLLDQLVAKKGDKSDLTLYEFMGAWGDDIQYQAAAPAPDPAAPAAAQAPGTAAPAAAAGAAAAGPAENPDQKRHAAFRKKLADHPKKGETIDVSGSAPLTLALPYLDGDSVRDTTLEIKGNKFTVGSHQYEIKLPRSAELRKIRFTEDKITLVAGKLFIERSAEIESDRLGDYLEQLRQGNVPPATDEIKFEKLTA